MPCTAKPGDEVTTSAAALFSVVMERTASRIQANSALPRLIAVEITPVPIALVKMSRSPACAPLLARICLRMNGSGHRVAELDLFIANAVPADDGAVGLDHLRQSAGQHLLQHLEVAAVGEADQRQRADRPSAHGVNVAQRVGGGDLSEDVRVVNDGGEEVDRLDERQLRRELIHAGVVGCVEADEHVGIVLPG